MNYCYNFFVIIILSFSATACLPVVSVMYSPTYPGTNANYENNYIVSCSGRHAGPNNVVKISLGSGVAVTASISRSERIGNVLSINLFLLHGTIANFVSNEIHFYNPSNGERWKSKFEAFPGRYEATRYVDVYHYYADTIVVQLPSIVIDGKRTPIEPITFKLTPYLNYVIVENC